MVIKNIINESRSFYIKSASEIRAKLKSLPVGSVKKRKINNKIYYYLQYRRGLKVIHKYLGKAKPVRIIQGIKERNRLEKELQKIEQSIRLLRKIKKRK